MKSLDLTTPHALILIGVPGSGKTRFGDKFAEMFHAPFIDAKSFANYGVSGAQLAIVGGKLADQLCRSGATFVYETATGTRTERAEIAKKCRSHGYEPLLIWVQADPVAAKTRLAYQARKQQQSFDETAFEAQLSRFTAPNAGEKPLVLSGMHTYASQAKVVLKRLSGGNAPRGRVPVPASRQTDAAPRVRRTVRVQ